MTRYRLIIRFYKGNWTELAEHRRDIFIEVDGSRNDALSYADKLVPVLFPHRIDFQFAGVTLECKDPRDNVSWHVNNKGQIISDD